MVLLNEAGCAFDELPDHEKASFPWLDTRLSWTERVAKYRRYLQEEACTKIGDSALTPVVLWEDAEKELERIDMAQQVNSGGGEKERIQDFHIQELQQEISRMNGILFGQNGTPGAIQRLHTGQEEILKAIDENRRTIAKIHLAYSKQHTKMQTKLDQHDKDLNGLGAKARTAVERVDALEEKLGGRAGKFLQAVWKAALPIAIGGVLTLLVLGIRAWILTGGTS